MGSDVCHDDWLEPLSEFRTDAEAMGIVEHRDHHAQQQPIAASFVCDMGNCLENNHAGLGMLVASITIDNKARQWS